MAYAGNALQLEANDMWWATLTNLQDTLLHSPLDHIPNHIYRLVLPQTVHAINRLMLDGLIPPGIHHEHIIGHCPILISPTFMMRRTAPESEAKELDVQVQANTSGFERDEQNQRLLGRLSERFDCSGALRLTHRSVKTSSHQLDI